MVQLLFMAHATIINGFVFRGRFLLVFRYKVPFILTLFFPFVDLNTWIDQWTHLMQYLSYLVAESA